ncbi:aminodeoxychorismate/anthranilate synthase component II [Thalassotalea aquiviva]|uniref:anthranilate synthase component II n=1 Tax=Thalassotalea aquiviva TaxID=3242415 RepID=UPI00352B7342
MILMIDNYDSFTFNLVHYFMHLEHEVKVIRNDELTIEQIIQLSPSHIVISPGPCDPNRAGISLEVLAKLSDRFPILGVCLGHQCIAQHFGGKVVRASKVMHGKTSLINHNQTGLFQDLNNPLQVTRYHSLLIEPNTLPSCLKVTAWIENELGEKEIMAIEHTQLPIMGVQFHPESVLTEQGHELLANFLSLTANMVTR